MSEVCKFSNLARRLDLIIGVDGNEANVKNRVGSNSYAYELLGALNKEPGYRFEIYLKEPPLNDLPPESDHWRYRRVRPKRFSTRFGLPLALFASRPRPDVFFSPGHYAPRWSPAPLVISVLDLSYLFFPGMFRRSDLAQLTSWTADSVRRARRVLTISESTRGDILRHYRVKPGKVVVAYPGLKPYPEMKEKKTSLGKYGVEGDFILYVGTLQPRKNITRLIESIPHLKDQSLKLVVVGKKGWLYDEILSKAKSLGLQERVIFTGFVPDEDLPAFYKKARCFVLVSLYEGFGLPALEAMHYGCPVVVSDVSSLPEVAGEAGILVDPQKPEAIAGGIEKAIGNRAELVKKGKIQAEKFSWEKCARETLAVLEEAAGKK